MLPKTIRDIDLSGIPTKPYGDSYVYNWSMASGVICKFIYDDIEGELLIKGCVNNVNNILTVQYLSEDFQIKTYHLVRAELGGIVRNIVVFAPDIIKYIDGGHAVAKLYTVGSGKKISMICPYCGIKKLFQINTLHRLGLTCICNSGFSLPNKLMNYILKSLNIDFESEKQFEWCKYKIKGSIKRGFYDFVFDNYIVEMDGEFHYIENRRNKLSLKDIQMIDAEKDRLAHENGYQIIRIDCSGKTPDRIRFEISKSKLRDVIDIEAIDWNYCFKKSESNLVKDIADYFNRTGVSAIMIADVFGFGATTIRRYLHRATNYGWCNYDSEKVMEIGRKKARELSNKRLSKEVAVFKNGKCLNTYVSGSELARRSLEDFGVEFNISGISAAALGKCKTYRGYILKYVSDTRRCVRWHRHTCKCLWRL